MYSIIFETYRTFSWYVTQTDGKIKQIRIPLKLWNMILCKLDWSVKICREFFKGNEVDVRAFLIFQISISKFPLWISNRNLDVPPTFYIRHFFDFKLFLKIFFHVNRQATISKVHFNEISLNWDTSKCLEEFPKQFPNWFEQFFQASDILLYFFIFSTRVAVYLSEGITRSRIKRTRKALYFSISPPSV